MTWSCAATRDFITPPIFDQQIGDRIYRCAPSSRHDPLFFIHGLLEVVEFLVTPKGARWQITDRLIDFAVAEGRYTAEITGLGASRRIDAFKLTWLGKALLEGLML